MIFDRIGASSYEHGLFPFLTGIAVFLFQILFPEIIRGAVTGYLTILVNYKIFKKAKKESVLIGILCGWLPIMAFVIFYHYTHEGVDRGLLDIVVNTTAFCVAMVSTHLSLAE
jgi:branched-subunit amino acid transport protein AzlD